MKLKFEIGFSSQGYAAPRAENVAVAQQGILCASSVVEKNLKGANESFEELSGNQGW